MTTFKKQQDCVRRYAASSIAFQTITRLIGWLGIVISAISFCLDFSGLTVHGLGVGVAVVLLAGTGFVILIGNVIKSQSDAILTILDLVGEPQDKQDNTD